MRGTINKVVGVVSSGGNVDLRGGSSALADHVVFGACHRGSISKLGIELGAGVAS